MFFNEWNVLLVDDDPDVLAVTKLALRDTTVYGLPIRIYTAESKAEAIKMLNTTFALKGASEGSLAVAFIDVVMETDHAGLELCDYIRNTLDNQSMQLYIRTGQPGVAPERDVIDKYDISGYFTKVETTEQKLYTLVKSGVRQWYSIYYAHLISDLTTDVVLHSHSRQELLDTFGTLGETVEGEPVSGLVFEDLVVLTDQNPDAVRILKEELDVLPPTILTPEGHKLVSDERGRVLVKILPTETTSNFYYVIEGAMVMPKPLLEITFRNGLVVSTLWKRAA